MNFAEETIGNLDTGDTSFERFLPSDRYKIIRKIGEGGMGAVCRMNLMISDGHRGCTGCGWNWPGVMAAGMDRFSIWRKPLMAWWIVVPKCIQKMVPWQNVDTIYCSWTFFETDYNVVRELFLFFKSCNPAHVSGRTADSAS
jgi:hypothetical protein